MTFGTAFVLRTRHKQTLPATRKAKTMFFQAKKNSRKTTRQTLSTEQLEPKAMFNAAPLQAEIGFEDRLSGDYDVNDAVLQVRSSQNVTCNTGFSGGGNYICNADSIWTNGGASTLRIGANSGPGGTTFMTGEDGVSIIHPSYHDGEDGVSIIHPSYHDGEGCRGIIDPEDNIGSTAGPGGSTYLRSDNRFVFETPKDDSGISLHASANPHAGPEGFMKLGDIKGEFRQTLSIGGSADSGGSTFMTGEDGRMIVHPQFNVGEDGRMIIHPQFNVGDDGRMIIHPQFNVGKATFTTGAGGDSIVHPQFNGGEDGRSIVHPQFCTVQPQVENVSMYDHIQAPRSQAFARMGR